MNKNKALHSLPRHYNSIEDMPNHHIKNEQKNVDDDEDDVVQVSRRRRRKPAIVVIPDSESEDQDLD